jgi:methyl-accepting chemotaxis protein
LAVVAEEVRSLAMRSAEAARHTAEMIEQSIRDAETGVEMNQKALSNLEEIKSHVNQVSKVMTDISSTSERQQHGIAAATIALNQMERMTRQYVVNSNQSMVESEGLTKQAEAMQDTVASFRLSSNGTPDPDENHPGSDKFHIDPKLLAEAIKWDS